jgi:hypothetical protein
VPLTPVHNGVAAVKFAVGCGLTVMVDVVADEVHPLAVTANDTT